MDIEAEKKKILREIFATNETDDSSSQNLQQVEYKIQNHRILQIFDNLIKCMGLIFCLPEMVRNEDLMTAYFDDYHDKEEVTMFCHVLMDDYMGVLHDGMSSHSLQLSSVFEKLMKSDLKNEVPEYIDYVSAHVNVFRLKILTYLFLTLLDPFGKQGLVWEYEELKESSEESIGVDRFQRDG